jgi:hypothetical protein
VKSNKQTTLVVLAFVSVVLSASMVSANEPIPIPDSSLLQDGQAYFNSANYQSTIHTSDSMSRIAKAQSPIGEDAAAYGFSAKSDEAKFFIIGTLYSEALAHLRGGDLKLAAERLESIEDQFVALQVPSALYSYISKVRSRAALGKYSNEVVMDMLSFFQPFFEDYAQGLSQDKLILFRAGSWLMDMSLTAAADDRELITQAKPQLVYFIKEMERMDAPKGVQEAYQDISEIADKKEISDKDVRMVLKQVKKIQTILG